MPPGLREFFLRKRAAQAEKPAGPTLSLSLPVAFALGLVLLSAIGWAFYLGMMVGRGENPEQHLQSMAGIIKKEEPKDQAGKVDAEAAAGDTATLTEPAQAPEAPQPVHAAQTAQSQPAPYPFARPKEHQLDAWDKPAPTAPKKDGAARPKAAPQAPPAKERTEKKAPAKGEVFVYTFQAAAYKSSRDAENLKTTLAKNGVSARTAKNGKVWLVIATARGDEAGANALRQKLQNLKLGKPLLLSKKAVAARPAKGRK